MPLFWYIPGGFIWMKKNPVATMLFTGVSFACYQQLNYRAMVLLLSHDTITVAHAWLHSYSSQGAENTPFRS